VRIGDFHASYRHDEALFDTRVQRAWFGVLLAALLAFPFVGGAYLVYLACLLGIHLISAAGLNVMTGYTGLISLGHAAFMGVGCYTVAVAEKAGVPFYLALPLAGFASAAIGLVVGIPSLRIKGLYFAVATLAAQFVLGFVFREWESVTGGVRGANVPAASLLGFELAGDRRIYFLIVPLAVVMLLGARNLFRTRVGRAFIAIRDRDISAEVLGISLFHYKLLAFAIGSFYAGVAGGLWGYFFRVATPELFGLPLSVFYLAAIIVGGLGSILGTILGATFMTMVPEVLRAMVGWAESLGVQNASVFLASIRQVVFGLLIVGFLIFEPHGLAEVWRRVRRFFHLWPFRT
jgi:branched-chain amino acid transport system permease protein